MAKTWEEMTPAEKIEDLRRDVLRIFAILRQYQDAIASDHHKLQSQIDDLKKRVS